MGGGFAYSGKITWKGAFIALLSVVGIVAFLDVTTNVYDGFGTDKLTYTTEPAKYNGGLTIVYNGKVTHQLRLLTLSGNEVNVIGEMADDMDKYEVPLTGKWRIKLSYETLTRYTRSGKVQGKFHRAISWKPLPYEENTGLSW